MARRRRTLRFGQLGHGAAATTIRRESWPMVVFVIVVVVVVVVIIIIRIAVRRLLSIFLSLLFQLSFQLLPLIGCKVILSKNSFKLFNCLCGTLIVSKR